VHPRGRELTFLLDGEGAGGYFFWGGCILRMMTKRLSLFEAATECSPAAKILAMPMDRISFKSLYDSTIHPRIL